MLWSSTRAGPGAPNLSEGRCTPLNSERFTDLAIILMFLIALAGVALGHRGLRASERAENRIDRARREADRWRNVAAGRPRPQPVPTLGQPVRPPAVTAELVPVPPAIKGHRR